MQKILNLVIQYWICGKIKIKNLNPKRTKKFSHVEY